LATTSGTCRTRAAARALSRPIRGSAKMRNATSPWSGLGYAQFNERTVRIKEQRTGTARPFPLWRLRSGLCCRPSIQYSGVASPQARIAFQHSGRSFGSAFCGPDPHCLTLCDPFATYRQVTHSPASTICRCITGALTRLLTFEPSCLPNSRHRSHVQRDAVCSTYVFTVSGTTYR
jgi:hypothetical protein